MTSARAEIRILRFGAFELDLRNNELRRGGVLVRLAPQQLRVLRFLAQNAGQVCTREEIQRNIWGEEVFVDFDRSLNVCIAQIRSALHDDSEAARFIRTAPRLGYQFVAPVEQVEEPAQEPHAAAPASARRWRRARVAAAAALVCAVCALAAILRWRAVTPEHRTMLAVLPFENATSRAEDAAVVTGLLDEMVTQFGMALPERLGVIGRTSVARYAGEPAGPLQIGRDLGVDYFIEGDVRSANGRVRISARLVKVDNQTQVWNETSEEDDSGRLEMQERVAAHVVAGALRTLFPSAGPYRGRAHQPRREAYEAFLNGRTWQYKDTNRAMDWFERAGTRDPAYAAPWAAIAETDVSLALSGSAPAAQAFDGARRAAERALRIDEGNAEAHDALANVLFWRDWKWVEAERHYLRSIALNPSFAQAHHDYAFWLVAMGREEAGVSSLRRAIALDPLSARVNVDAGWVLLQAHHFAEAITQARRALELEPGLREARACIARAELYRGKASTETLDFYRRNSGQGDPYQRALSSAVLGQWKDTLSALRAAFEQRDSLMPMVGSEPAFAAIHGDPEYREIVRRMGLPN